MSQRIVTLLLFLMLPVTSYCQLNTGVIDLQTHNFDTEGIARLSGTWQFYYGRLLSSDELKKEDAEFIQVPGSWHRQGDYNVLGYGTYRCLVYLPKNHKNLILQIPTVGSACKVWINGVERASSGIVSAQADRFEAQLKTVYASIPEDLDTLEMVIQVANFAYFNAGLVSSPRIGLSSQVIENKSWRNGLENFFAGSLMAMFIYQIILFFLYRSGKPNLWLALICLGVALRSMIISGGSYLLPNLFQDIPYEVWKKIEFGSVYVITGIFPLYIHHLFKEASSRIAITIFVIIASILGLVVLVTPQYIYGKLLELCHIMYILAFLYALFTIIKAGKAGNKDARIIFFGVLASFPFIFLEIIKNSAFIRYRIPFDYLVELGVLIFLLFQVYILARHYAFSYRSLEASNEELEEEVTQRTADLIESNEIKERLLSVISHDVKSPLNSLQGLITLYRATAITREQFEHYVDKLEGDLSTTNGLVENILFWTASQRKGESVKKELLSVSRLVKESVDHMQSIARNKTLQITYDVSDRIQINSDRGILHFCLRNLLANAIKFSHPGGVIHAQGAYSEGNVILRVTDYGIGMDEGQQALLFAAERTQSTIGTKSEKGTGLGLGLCREYLVKIGGELTVTSDPGKGSTFTILLPDAQDGH